MNKYINVLSKCSLFKGKEKQAIIDILSRLNYKINHYQKNDFIFRADQTPDYIGIVLKGSIEIQNNMESGKFFNVLYKKEGDTFGGGLVFANTPIYKFNFIAKTGCDILLIYKQSIFEVLLLDKIIMKNILQLLAKSTIILNEKIELFSYSSIQKKIACSLLYNTKNDNTINLLYSKKAWAEHLNVSRSSLCRELKKLSDAGIIEINNKKIKILKKDNLKAILDNL